MKEVLLSNINEYISQQSIENFDELVFKLFFDEILIDSDFSRLRVDGYYDAGIDYVIFTCNKKQFFELSDLKELISGKDNIIDIHVIQIKDSSKMTSNVPNHLIEVFSNLFSSKDARSYKHYNQQVKDFIKLVKDILRSYALSANTNFHFYYISKCEKKQISTAVDLMERFNTLIDIVEKQDICYKANFYIFGLSDIFGAIKKTRRFEYTFKDIDKYSANVDASSNQVNSAIALIPIKQYYDLITFDNENYINDRLFESNIRDFKGRSSVNSKIKDTLESISPDIFIDFWWLNNGVTITVEELRESMSQKQILIENPQIVNGLQTSYAIYNHFKSNPHLLESEQRKLFTKIIKIPKEHIDLELSITVAANSQNEIRDKDIHANDEVQKNIELFLKQKGKYYQRKDKYYTNRNIPKSDIIKLTDMAKYINTIFHKDPSYTRNNPGKILSGKRYTEVFLTHNIDQNYERYYTAYCIYEKAQSLYRGKTKIEPDEFDKANFIHHIVFIIICLLIGKTDYKPEEVLHIEISKITEDKLMEAEKVLFDVLKEKNISNAKVLKTIKETGFSKDLVNHLNDKLSN